MAENVRDIKNCKAKDPSNCRYHGTSTSKQSKPAVSITDYASYEKSRAAQETKVTAQEVNSTDFINENKFRNIKKMPALFVIDRKIHEATTEINENAAWIFNEPSRATIKRDGTNITVTEDGQIFARRSVKKGKVAPPNYIPAEVDSFTGHSFGLEPMEQSTFHKMFQEATNGETLPAGTYELCGPKINGNPENLTFHKLLLHGSDEATKIPDMTKMPKAEAYETLKGIFATYKERGVEGVVWWGANGKRTKLRVKDFFGDPNRRY